MPANQSHKNIFRNFYRRSVAISKEKRIQHLDNIVNIQVAMQCHTLITVKHMYTSYIIREKMIILGNKGDYWSSLNFYQLKVWIIFIFNPSDGMYHHQSKGYDETLTDVPKI